MRDERKVRFYYDRAEWDGTGYSMHFTRAVRSKPAYMAGEEVEIDLDRALADLFAELIEGEFAAEPGVTIQRKQPGKQSG